MDSMESSCERDSVVVNATNTEDSLMAAACDGRFLFILDKYRITSVGTETEIGEPLEDDECGTYSLDEIDLFTSRRIVFKDVGDLYGLDNVIDIVAFNEQSLTLIEYHTAHCDYYRAYRMILHPDVPRFLNSGTNTSVIFSPFDRAYVFPTNPLSAASQRDISSLAVQAGSYVSRFYDQLMYMPLDGTAWLSVDPFVINDNAVGFFVDGSPDFDTDIMSVVVLNLSDDSVYLQDVEPPPGSDYEEWTEKGINHTVSNQAHDGEVVLTTDGFAGVLDTRLMQWMEVKVMFDEDDPHQCTIGSTGGSHLIFMESVSDVGDDRLISDENEDEESIHSEEMMRVRLIGHPLKVPSLVRLSSIAVQKCAAVQSQLQLQQIGERFV